MTCFFIWHPIREQIEQQRVVGQLFGQLGWMRPIAAPNTALRGRNRVSTRDGAGVCVSWRSTFGVGVGARQLHPCATLVDECTDLAEERMVHSIRLWDVGEMIKHDR